MSLAHEVHRALAATAVPRTPDPALLPPLAAPGSTRPLADPAPVPGALGTALADRRSRYRFGPAPDPAAVAALLRAGVGTAPRAGGLPSVRAYLVTADGVDRADLRLPLPGLVAVRRGPTAAYVAGAVDQPAFAPRVPLWLALVADLAPSAGRYPPRHYRTVHLDAGAALQNVLLVATALGLVTCPVAGYDDAAWARLLDLDDRDGEAFVAVLVALSEAPAGSRSARRPVGTGRAC
ncbi:nitroreductase family protein [Nocardioides litoris]|uniref:nitroreductase family protein n=1 Tax=Nocardioides litoris TaxID=1926648 RepID=UPI001476A33D|nr:nitroreductase family protein [Nocardioides litoris]